MIKERVQIDGGFERKTIMYQILEAFCQNGNLILDEKLSTTMEGKRFKIILLENHQDEQKKEHFLNKHSFKLPEDYQFNREEIHER